MLASVKAAKIIFPLSLFTALRIVFIFKLKKRI